MKINSFGKLGIGRGWIKDKRAVNILVGFDWLRIGIAWQNHVNLMVNSKTKSRCQETAAKQLIYFVSFNVFLIRTRRHSDNDSGLGVW